jgi:hypothetical protein
MTFHITLKEKTMKRLALIAVSSVLLLSCSQGANSFGIARRTACGKPKIEKLVDLRSLNVPREGA